MCDHKRSNVEGDSHSQGDVIHAGGVELTQPCSALTAIIAAALHCRCKFVCTAAATPDGTALNLANLGGEYAILLGSDGLATFTINGYPLSGLPWREEEGVYIVDYNGAYDLRFVPIPGGLELDYFGTMVLTFSPAP